MQEIFIICISFFTHCETSWTLIFVVRKKPLVHYTCVYGYTRVSERVCVQETYMLREWGGVCVYQKNFVYILNKHLYVHVLQIPLECGNVSSMSNRSNRVRESSSSLPWNVIIFHWFSHTETRIRRSIVSNKMFR